MTSAHRRLVLWDVDGTLLRAGPFGRGLYGAAFEQATGVPMRVQATTYGRLDHDIYHDTLLANDLNPAAHPFPLFAAALAAVYAAHAAELRERGCALPGAVAALAALAAEPLAVQTVLTGNLRTVAHVKLAAFDLDRHLDLGIGAYAEDGDVRADLVPVARRRAGAKHATAFDAAATVIIGDSHRDVAAGHGAGVRVVAVATGQDGRDALAGADVVLDDLADTAAVLRAILGSR